MIPTLETARLLLRPYRAADLPPLLALWQQPQFYQYVGGQPLPEQEVWMRLLRSAGLWTLCGYGYWAIEEKATGHFVGMVGFGDFRRPLTPPLGDTPESGWLLAPALHGQGYAAEALEAALAWGDAHLPQSRTVCIIDAANAPSLRLAARLGYHEYARTEFLGQNTVLLERQARSPRPESEEVEL